MARRRLYIPITRSGSSILASIFTQMIDEGRRVRTEETKARLDRGEISPTWAFVTLHPYFVIFGLGFLGILFSGAFK